MLRVCKRYLVFLAICISGSVQADKKVLVDGITWSYRLVDGEAMVTGASPSKGVLTIPSRMNGSLVTMIGYEAFKSCSGLTGVKMPSCLTSVGSRAFSGCVDLMNVEMSPSVTNIGVAAFLYCYGLSSIELPPHLCEINESVFYGCNSLEDVVLSSSVTNIGATAFCDCRRLPTIVLPPSVKSIGRAAFSSCSSLVSVMIPSGVTYICKGAFSSCSALKALEIPSSVESIEDDAFSSCSSLVSVLIPSGVTYIGERAFSGCSALKTLEIPRSVESIGNDAFYNCGELRDVTVPECVIKRGIYRTFYQSHKIDEVRICDGVEEFAPPSDLFGLEKMTKLYLPSSLKTMNVCSGCPSLRSVTLPQCVSSLRGYFPDVYGSITNVAFCEGVTLIRRGVLADCYDVKKVTIPSGVKSIESGAFNGCHRLMDVVFEQPSSVVNIDSAAFFDCSQLEVIDIPMGVTSVGPWAFSTCRSLRSVTIPRSVEEIGYAAFEGCRNLASIIIPSSLTALTNSVFYDCGSLTNVVIPSSVRKIGNHAFYNCSSLMNVVIPSGVTNIGTNAFCGCSNSIRMDFECKPPEGISDAGISEWAYVRYNIAHQGEWQGVIASCKFKRACSYSPKPLKPLFDPESCAMFDDILTVSIESSAGATIYYTLDGSTPTEKSLPYARKFRIDKKATISAIAIYDSGMCSEIAIAKYAKGMCSNPVIFPQSGTVFAHSNQDVSIEWDRRDGVVHYTLDGSDPTVSSPAYVGPFQISNTTIVKAMVFSDEYFDSQIVSANLTRRWLTVATPEISAATSFVGAENPVSISCSTKDAIIHYTMDGSVPTVASEVYTGPLAVSNSCVIKAFAVCDDYLGSAVASIGIERNWLPVSDPVISTKTSFTGSKTPVEISCPTDGATIYYTADGSEPTLMSSVYGGIFYVTNSCTIRALSVLSNDVYRGSATVSSSITRLWAIGDALNVPDMSFLTGGNIGWVRDTATTHDGMEAMRSGAIGNSQSSSLSTTVEGAGILSFWLKVSCENSDGYYDYDHIEFYVDGSVCNFDGEQDWTNIVVRIDTDGLHTLRWVYVKDNTEKTGDDCVWIDQFSWLLDPIPNLGDNPTEEQIADALEDSTDAKLVENITDGETYNDFRDWAETIGAQTVKESPNAWVSFALGQDTLLKDAPTDEDLEIEAFEPAAVDGKFDFTVSVKDIEVGSTAAAENLKKVFGLEGGSSLEGLSSDNVDITFGTPKDGKVKFTAGPNADNADATTFFMKVKLAP